jgi:hypothetical protein
MVGLALVAPAAVFGGVGKALEGIGALLSPRRRDPDVRVTRTQMRD